MTIGKSYNFGKYVNLREVKIQSSNNNTIITNNNKYYRQPIIIQDIRSNNKKEQVSAFSITTTINHFENSTRIIRVTEPTYLKFREHSRMYHNVSSYEEILNELLDFYAKHHDKKYFS